MAHHEPTPTYTIVDADEYDENVPNRLTVEEMMGSDEVFVFYGRIARLNHVAMRAYASVDIESFEANGIRAIGSITFRDQDFSPAMSDYGFSGLFHARFFLPDSVNPILVRPSIIKRPIENGILVREDGGYEAELLDTAALPTLDRDPELVG